MTKHHMEHSNALQRRLADGTTFLTGPMAQLHHHTDKLHPITTKMMKEVKLKPSEHNPYHSIMIRSVKLMQTFTDALDLIDAYAHPKAPFTAHTQGTGINCNNSKAPRDLLWHHYEVNTDDLITDTMIIPPTSQNQAHIKDDLQKLRPHLISMDHDRATHLYEQLIHSYNPYISYATHFLDLRIEQA